MGRERSGIAKNIKAVEKSLQSLYENDMSNRSGRHLALQSKDLPFKSIKCWPQHKLEMWTL